MKDEKAPPAHARQTLLGRRHFASPRGKRHTHHISTRVLERQDIGIQVFGSGFVSMGGCVSSSTGEGHSARRHESTGSFPVQKTDAEWRKELTANEYAVRTEAQVEHISSTPRVLKAHTFRLLVKVHRFQEPLVSNGLNSCKQFQRCKLSKPAAPLQCGATESRDRPSQHWPIRQVLPGEDLRSFP